MIHSPLERMLGFGPAMKGRFHPNRSDRWRNVCSRESVEGSARWTMGSATGGFANEAANRFAKDARDGRSLIDNAGGDRLPVHLANPISLSQRRRWRR